jgi:hypothetical protein
VDSQVLSALISAGTSAIVAAILSPWLAIKWKAREDKRRRDVELRYTEYTRYLAAVGDIDKAVRERADRFLRDTLPSHLEAAIGGTFDATRFQRETSTFVLDATIGIAAQRRELAGLRLIGSDGVVALVEEYTRLLDEILKQALRIAGASLEDMQPNSTLRREIEERAQRSKALQDTIIKRMRQDLGTA